MPTVRANFLGIPASCIVMTVKSMISKANGWLRLETEDRPYLQLVKGKASTSSNPPVILDGGTANDGAKLVDRTRSKLSSFLQTSFTTTFLAAGLGYFTLAVCLVVLRMDCAD